MKEVMDSFSDPRIKTLVVVAAAQISKTETLLNILGYMIDQDPGPALYCVPTKEFAEDFSKRRLAPMIRDTAPIRDKVAEAKSRISGNTIMKKMYPGGMISLIGSNSPTDLAGTPARYIFADEIDRWTNSAGTEGDPWSLLERRTTTFYNAKMVAVSTPTIKDASKIVDLYNLGTMEKWCVKCPSCGKYHFITFKDIKFTHKEVKVGDTTQYKVTDIYYLCPHCAGKFTESEIKRADKKWVADSPEAIENGTRSFWINGFYSPWNSWEKIILRFLEANGKKDFEELKTVYNTLFGELWDDKYQVGGADELLKRREEYESDLPDGVLCLTMGVDTQDDWMQYEVVGYGIGGESWGIETGKVLGKPDSDAVWEVLDSVREREWHFSDGMTLRISLTFVDMGGHYSQEVRERCAERFYGKVFCVHGLNIHDAPYTAQPNQVEYINPRTNRSGKVWHYPLGVDAGKEHIMSALTIKEPGPKYCHFPVGRNYDEEYFDSLLSERLTFTDAGKPKWEKITLRNEALDCRNYANAAFTVLNPNMESLAALRRGVELPKKHVRRVRRQRRDIYDGDLL